MNEPFIRALGAAIYIVVIVFTVNTVTMTLKGQNPSLIIPMTVLSLFVLSAAIMGYLFLSESLQLYLDGHKKEAVIFFGKIVGFFACFVALFGILALLL